MVTSFFQKRSFFESIIGGLPQAAQHSVNLFRRLEALHLLLELRALIQ